MLTVHILDLLYVQDNYNFLLRDEATGTTAVVDPSEAGATLEALDERGWSLDYVLCTHHHWDHVNGIPKLKEKTGCKVVANAADAHRIPGGIDVPVQPGGLVALGDSVADIIDVSGHTIGHIAYYFSADAALFCGDALFAMGCGRMFEGDAPMYFDSLQRIKALPDATRMFCAHEYTIPNGRFAKHAEPENSAITQAIERAKARRREGKPSIPTLLGDEKATNPFLRVKSAEDFAHMRERKNHF